MQYNSFLKFQKANLCKDVIFPVNNSALLPSAVMRSVSMVKIEVGKDALLNVKKGSRVDIGTLIANADTTPVYSSVSGKVVSAKKNDGFICIETVDEQKTDENLKKPRISSAKALVKAFKDCGLCEHEKLTSAETLIINCCENDPVVSANQLCATEDYDNIFKAVYLLKKYLGFKNIIFAADSNQKNVFYRFTEIIGNNRDKYENTSVMWITSFVPNEELLSFYVLGKEKANTEFLVLGVQTVAKFGEYVKTGMPIVSKRVTVDGIVNTPQNVIVPLGAPVNEIFEFCGGVYDIPSSVSLGGALAKETFCQDECFVQKDTACVFVQGVTAAVEPTACIGCARCADYCPIKLYPFEVEDAVLKENYKKLSKQNVDKCIECGVCGYVCPAARPLLAAMAEGKKMMENYEPAEEKKFNLLKLFKKGDKGNE